VPLRAPLAGGGPLNRGRGSRREYPREARVSELVREILGERCARLADDDERLGGVVITGVEVERELRQATVWYDADDPDDAHAGLTEHRVDLQAAINDQARLRRTPVLEFRYDHAIAEGSRVDEILAGLDIPPAEPEAPAEPH
jgi:ribosome-binding factor A